MLLTRWNYSPEEWKRFLQWKTRKKGKFWFWLRKLAPIRVPEVSILADRVAVNKVQEPFSGQHRRFREISIREAGSLNILEICYEQGNAVRGINIPIPKGKLREAFEIRERLMIGSRSVG